MKSHPLERFIKESGLKLVWLANELGESPEMMRYYFRNDSLPVEHMRKAKRIIAAKAKELRAFAKEKKPG